MTDRPQCQAVGAQVRDHTTPVPVKTRCRHRSATTVTVSPAPAFAERWGIERTPRAMAVCRDHLSELTAGRTVERIIGEQRLWPNRPITEDVVLVP